MDQIGRYRVLRLLASGGMGQVFLAEDPTLERQVALKVLFRDPDRGLQREAKTLAALSHPNIVTIFEIGEHEGRDFIAMEYLPGKTLRDILTARPSREELLAIVTQVAVAVAAAHKVGILHRDIKPENVITTPNGVKVVDFGIARRLEQQRKAATSPDDLYELLLTPGPRTMLDGMMETMRDAVATPGTQTVFGTPAYMAPEVLGGEPSTEASDVYGLGVMLYECLAGKRPYDAGNLIETIANIIQAPPPTLADPLNPLITRMLAREPQARPSLSEVISGLRPLPGIAPVRRRKWIAGAAFSALIGGVVVIVVMPRDRSSDLPVDAPPRPVVTLSIALAPVKIEMGSWGIYSSDPDAVANTLVTALTDVQGARVDAFVVTGADLPGWQRAAHDAKASYLLVLQIAETTKTHQLTGTVHVFDAGTKKQHGESRHLTAPSTELRRLEYDMLDAALSEISTEISLPRVHDRAKAQTAVSEGRTSVQNGNFSRARTAYEAAVAIDPTLFEAWYGLALSYAWTEAPEELTLQAAEKAHELAPAGRRKEVMRGAALVFRERFKEAREVLEQVEVAGDAGADQLELLYFLGEANWHDGRHDAGYAYLRRAFEIPPRSRGIAIHPAQYLIARRRNDDARYLLGLAGLTDTAQIEFSVRNYAKLAAGSEASYRVMSKLVLGQPVLDAELAATYSSGPLELAAIRAALAIAAGDHAKAGAIFERVWTEHSADHERNPGEFYQLEYLGEVVVAAGMVDEARRIVKLLAAESKARPRRGYHRLSILTAALARDPSLLVAGPTVSERNHALASAAVAEISGDHATAAAGLAQIVENPSTTWDYVERAALLRNLRAIGDKQRASALCKDTLQPAGYRHAYSVLRALCTKR